MFQIDCADANNPSLLEGSFQHSEPYFDDFPSMIPTLAEELERSGHAGLLQNMMGCLGPSSDIDSGQSMAQISVSGLQIANLGIDIAFLAAGSRCESNIGREAKPLSRLPKPV